MLPSGNQPDGEMDHSVLDVSVPGFEEFKTIEIRFLFPKGSQDESHPFPGKSYKKMLRKAYLPATTKGLELLRLVKVAFDRKLLFTVDVSQTTGKGEVTFNNNINFKTTMRRDPERHGYPDPDYLDRLEDELKQAGIGVDGSIDVNGGAEVENGGESVSEEDSIVEDETSSAWRQDDHTMTNGGNTELPTKETGAIPKVRTNVVSEVTDDDEYKVEDEETDFEVSDTSGSSDIGRDF